MLKKFKKTILVLLVLVSILSTTSMVSFAAGPDIAETTVSASMPIEAQGNIVYMGLLVLIPHTAIQDDGVAHVVVVYLDANGITAIWGGAFAQAGIAQIPILYQAIYSIQIT